MFERFTDRARRVIVLAQEEAKALRYDYVGTEHILLGLIKEQQGVAAKALQHADITYDVVVREIRLGTAMYQSTARIPFTESANKVCEYALREMLDLHHAYVGTEHLLLGLIRLYKEADYIDRLSSLGIALDSLRQQVIDTLNSYSSSGEAPEPVNEESMPDIPANDALLREVLRLLTVAPSNVLEEVRHVLERSVQ